MPQQLDASRDRCSQLKNATAIVFVALVLLVSTDFSQTRKWPSVRASTRTNTKLSAVDKNAGEKQIAVGMVKTEPHNELYPNRQHDTKKSFTKLSLKELLSRGHFITNISMCGMVRWFVGTYEMGKNADGRGKCLGSLQRDKDRVPTDVRNLSDYDTIFVAEYARDLFIDSYLSKLEKDVIVFTRNHVVFDPRKTEIILNHPRVLHMFSMNPWRTHPKLSGFPLGLKAGKELLDEYRNEFQRAVTREKESRVFVSYLGKDMERKPERDAIPSAPKPLNHTEYLRQLHEHEYVLSPNGDHPDCYRHWEGIGLGTVPITMMEREKFLFFEPAPVVFDRPLPWNVTEMELTLPHNVSTNRRMVFEEYWYEYAEAIVGGSLNWSPSSFWSASHDEGTKKQPD